MPGSSRRSARPRGSTSSRATRAQVVARTVANDEALAVAIRDGDRAALQERLEDLAQRGGAVRVRLTLDGQQEPIEAGGGDRGRARAQPRRSTRTGDPAGRMSALGHHREDYAEPAGPRDRAARCC